jgi:hypothetical protein
MIDCIIIMLRYGATNNMVWAVPFATFITYYQQAAPSVDDFDEFTIPAFGDQ